MKTILKIIFFIFLTLISCRCFFHLGVPVTHDGNNHLVRFANYKIALRELQIPPRLAPNLLNAYGYPVFNYNYPLANILSLPFSILDISYEFTFKTINIAFVFLAFFGANLFLKSKNFSKISRFFALLVFALNPYLLSNLVFRGNIGEVMAWGILPWIFYLLEILKTEKKFFTKTSFYLICCLLILFLAHNIIAFFASLLLIFYLIFNYWHNWQAWKKFILSFIWAFTGALWFWLPAIMEKNLTILDNVDLTLNYAQHFPSFTQLLRVPINFGYSYWGQVDSMSLGLGAIQCLLIFLAIIYLIKSKLKKELVFFIALFVLLFGQLAISKFFYQVIPFANFIQFPWRLALLLSIVLLPISARLFDEAKKPMKLLLFIILIFQLLQFLQVKPIDYRHKTQIDYDADADTTSVNRENLPKTFTFEYFAKKQALVFILDGAGTVDLKSWNGSARHYFLKLEEPSVIVESTAYFSGWETTANKQKITYLDNDVIKGRLAYSLPAGDYEIKSRFTQRTWPRLLGNSVSLLSFFGLGFFGFYLMRMDRKKEH